MHVRRTVGQRAKHTIHSNLNQSQVGAGARAQPLTVVCASASVYLLCSRSEIDIERNRRISAVKIRSSMGESWALPSLHPKNVSYTALSGVNPQNLDTIVRSKLVMANIVCRPLSIRATTVRARIRAPCTAAVWLSVAGAADNCRLSVLQSV